MASIQSREAESLREGIVNPLMKMMSTLSNEMRKNLTEEVSILCSKLDEVDSKVDYLIAVVEGNNNKSKDEQTYVPDSHAFFRHSATDCSGESEDHICLAGGPLLESQRKERAPEKTAEFQPPGVGSNGLDSRNISSDRGLEERDTQLDHPYEIGNNSSEDRESYNNGKTSIPKMTNETQAPYSAKNVYAEGHDRNSKTVTVKIQREEEINVNSIIDKPLESNPDMKDNPVKELENEESVRHPLPIPKEVKDDQESVQLYNVTSVGFDREESDKDHSALSSVSAKEENSLVEKDMFKRQGWSNFGNAENRKRSKSPPLIRAKKENVPYISFKKTKTEFSDDNRKTYLENAFHILHTDVGKRAEELSFVENQEPEGASPSQGNDRMPIKPVIKEDLHAQDTIQKEDKSIVKMSNNQQLAPSGFKNEHGDEDNRFVAAAHEVVLHSSVTRRSLSLSNLHLVKNGPRRVLGKEEVASTVDVTSGNSVAGAVSGSHHPVRGQKQEENGTLKDDDVLYSLIERERLSVRNCTDLKSQGIDTVICLDTSSSMAGKPMITAIDTILKLIDGFENNAIYNDLEENVAIVTFGKENKILCHLTNDYSLLRDTLASFAETVTAGGPSPLWLGLALSLAEIKERGGECQMDPITVLPRIILLTDGYASVKNLLEGEDKNNVDAQAFREILSLLTTCRDFTSYMECITFGPYQDEILTTLTDGRMFTENDVEYLTQFFRVQEEANNLAMKVIDGEYVSDEIPELVQNSRLGSKAKDDLQLFITKAVMSSAKESKQSEGKSERATVTEIQNNDANHSKASEEDTREHNEDSENKGSNKQQENPEAKKEGVDRALNDGQPDILASMDEIDDVKSPTFGTAVIPSSDSVDFLSRRNLTGTIIGARKKGLVKILWSDGTTEKCRYGVNGQYDFKVSKDQAVDCSEIRIGSVVKRGNDWRWNDQDGGEGNIGVVMKIEGPVIHVIWPHGGQGNYRFGYNKKYDLSLSEKRHTEGSHSAWFIEEEEGLWRYLPTEVSDTIEQMYKADHTGTFLIKSGEKSLRISIPNLHARDTSTQVLYPIERRELSNEEWLAAKSE